MILCAAGLRTIAGVTRRQHDADQHLGLMEAGFDGINGVFAGFVSGWSKKGAGYNDTDVRCAQRKRHAGARHRLYHW